MSPSGSSEAVLVDVAVPARHRTRFIPEAIESVLAQTLVDWRLTISDNGGRVAQAVQPYLSDSRIRYVATERDRSLAENWTAAIAHGNAPYVGLLNDDDRWAPRFLERRVTLLEQNARCGFAFSGNRTIDREGHELGRSPLRFAEGVVSSETMITRLREHNFVAVSSVLMRRSCLDAVEPRFGDEWVQCDWEMWGRLVARFPVAYLRVRDNDYRIHGDQSSYAEVVDAEAYDRLLRHLDDLAASAGAGARTRRQRNRALANILLIHAMNAYDHGSGQQARRLRGAAIRSYRPARLDSRSLALAVLPLLGARARPPVSRLRTLLRHYGDERRMGRLWQRLRRSERSGG